MKTLLMSVAVVSLALIAFTSPSWGTQPELVVADAAGPQAEVLDLALPVSADRLVAELGGVTAEADCELPLQGCGGLEAEYCDCLNYYNPLYCYKVLCLGW